MEMQQMKRGIRAVCAFSALLAISLASSVGRADNSLAVGGTGAAVGVFELLADAYAKHDPATRIEIVPGLGSGGGIKAVKGGAIDLSASGRALKPEESAAGLQAMAWFTTPMAFVSSHANPNGFTAAELAGIVLRSVRQMVGWDADSDHLTPGRQLDDQMAGEKLPRHGGCAGDDFQADRGTGRRS